MKKHGCRKGWPLRHTCVQIFYFLKIAHERVWSFLADWPKLFEQLQTRGDFLPIRAFLGLNRGTAQRWKNRRTVLPFWEFFPRFSIENRGSVAVMRWATESFLFSYAREKRRVPRGSGVLLRKTLSSRDFRDFCDFLRKSQNTRVPRGSFLTLAAPVSRGNFF